MSDPDHVDTVYSLDNYSENSSSFSAGQGWSQTARKDGCKEKKLDVFRFSGPLHRHAVHGTLRRNSLLILLGLVKKTLEVGGSSSIVENEYR
jgi:hypothetical protein